MNYCNNIDCCCNNIKKDCKYCEYCIYLLVHTKHNKTYLGITNNTRRRLRQHNCIIKGGAKYTSCNLHDGVWKYYAIIPNLNKRESLSFERIIKNKRRKGKGKLPVDKRMYLISLLKLNYELIDTNHYLFNINNDVEIEYTNKKLH